MSRRRIRNGKLQLLNRLIGGPKDGLIVDPMADEIRLPIKTGEPPTRLGLRPPPIEDILKVHVYVRTSDETLTYKGIE